MYQGKRAPVGVPLGAVRSAPAILVSVCVLPPCCAVQGLPPPAAAPAKGSSHSSSHAHLLKPGQHGPHILWDSGSSAVCAGGTHRHVPPVGPTNFCHIGRGEEAVPAQVCVRYCAAVVPVIAVSVQSYAML